MQTISVACTFDLNGAITVLASDADGEVNSVSWTGYEFNPDAPAQFHADIEAWIVRRFTSIVPFSCHGWTVPYMHPSHTMWVLVYEFDDEPQVVGCSCGMADQGAPGHDDLDSSLSELGSMIRNGGAGGV